MKKFLIKVILESTIESEDISEVFEKFLKSTNLDSAKVSKHEIDELDQFGLKVKVEKGFRVN